MTTATEIDTRDVIAGMLTENTGSHFLDSGGAYGRNWERQAGKTRADFEAEPEVQVEWSLRTAGPYDRGKAEGEPLAEALTYINLYHFMRDRLEYAPELDDYLREFGQSPAWENESWFSTADAWLDELEAMEIQTVNSYNGECALSQTIEVRIFVNPEDDEQYVIVMVHGGCDVRGGYTAPRVFKCYEWEILDWSNLTAYCTNDGEPAQNPEQINLTGEAHGEPRCDAAWDSYNAGYTFEDVGNCYPAQIKDLGEYPAKAGTKGEKGFLVVDEDRNVAFCPVCGTSRIGFAPPYASC